MAFSREDALGKSLYDLSGVHKTSVNLEEPFWTEGYRHQTQNNAAGSDQQHRYLREYDNLSSAL
jgi:predicted DNA-binding ribbon-helix-helix protein